MNKKFHIVTTGCQMNVLDSELAAALLISRGYTKAESQKEAEVILFNTCSVREHAEEKIYSALGRLKHWKSHHPDGVIGVFGCMAQKDRWVIFRRAPHVDVVVDFTDTALIFGVQDDGCGFDPDDMPPAGHLGLDSMRKHAEGLGGTLTVTSEPGKGTSLTVRIPL